MKREENGCGGGIKEDRIQVVCNKAQRNVLCDMASLPPKDKTCVEALGWHNEINACLRSLSGFHRTRSMDFVCVRVCNPIILLMCVYVNMYACSCACVRWLVCKCVWRWGAHGCFLWENGRLGG